MKYGWVRTSFVHIFCAICVTFVALSATSGSAGRPHAAILKSGPAWQDVAALYRHAGYVTSVVGQKDMEGLTVTRTSTVVIPPRSLFPASARRQLSSYLKSGGTLVDLCPGALAYTHQPAAHKRVADFAVGGGYTVNRPASAGVTKVAGPGGGTALQFDARMVVDGELSVSMPLKRFRSGSMDMICFQAKGDYNIDVLKVAVNDSSGSTYAGFVELGRGWRSYALPMADLIEVTRESAPRPLDPAKAETVTLGISTLTTWKAATGSLAIGPVSLARSVRNAGVMTSAVARWRPQCARAKAAFPEWIVDPFLDAVRLPANTQVHLAGTTLLAQAGQCFAIQPAPVFRGEWKYEVGDELKRREMRRRPLLVAKALDGRWRTVAETRTMTDGPYKGASMVLFGVDSATYAPGTALGKALVRATDYVVRTPRIVKLRPATSKPGEDPAQHCCKVVFANPLSHPIGGELVIDVANGKMKARQPVALRPGLTEVEVKIGVVPADFPMTHFRWSAKLTTAQGEDTWADTVDLKRSLIEAAGYILDCQKAYRDGRFGEHFFTEIYAARLLHALGLRTGERKMIESGLRFCDMLVARQRPDGGIPLGYADNSGVIYTADDGTDVIGLLQIASWMNDAQRAKTYIEASRKYLAFREALYVTPEKSARLQEQFGKDAAGTKVGNYGLGILKSDYIKGDRVPWPELKTEERGVPFVLTISMGAPAAMQLLDPKPEYLAVVKRDADEYLTGYYPMSKSSHFAAECVFWMRQALTDKPTQAGFDAKIRQFMPFTLGEADGAFYFQARGSLRLLSMAYYRRFIADEPHVRAAMLQSIWDACSHSSSYSMASVGAHFPVVSYGPSEGGFRYVTYTSIGLVEILQPGSTLLGPKRP